MTLDKNTAYFNIIVYASLLILLLLLSFYINRNLFVSSIVLRDIGTLQNVMVVNIFSFY